MNYQPHVDGLRAVAIILVLSFHAGLNIFPSGFIGVDIFFVISGFLITSIIYQSLKTSQFSFLQFYNRRLWRLQPVFICLLLTTTLFTFYYYLPPDLLIFGKTVRKTSVFLANHAFERITTGYFTENTNTLPLLHTWSLAIEWQCYLLMPLVIYLLYRLCGTRHLPKIIYGLTFLFFCLTLHYSASLPAKNYYLFSSRIFEFLIGSSVALAPKPLGINRFVANSIGFLAILTLIYLARCTGINLGFPNEYTLILCLATALLIAIGEHPQKPLCIRWLSLKPVVFIGLLSYSLYIWHWPVFAIMRYLSLQETPTGLISLDETPMILFMAFAVIFIIAYLSWHFIEKPSRRLNKIKFSYSLILLFILPLAVFHLSAYAIKKNNGFPSRFKEGEHVYALLEKYSSKNRISCMHFVDTENIGVESTCYLGSKNPTSFRGFLFGDSHANHYWRFIDVLAKKANISVISHSTGACLSLPGIAQFYKGNQVYQHCQDQNNLYYKMIKENHYDFVLISHFWDIYLTTTNIINKIGDKQTFKLSRQRMAKALDKAVQLIVETGAKPILIKSIATTKKDLHNCFYKHIRLHLKYKAEQCNFVLEKKQSEWFDKLFAKLQRKYPSLILIDPKKIQCPQGMCRADIDGLPLFRDLHHITDYASYKMGKAYSELGMNPFV